MMTFVLTFLFLLLIVGGMSIGLFLGRKPISGTCGGMSAVGMDTVCDICGGDPNRCDEENEDGSAPAKLSEKAQSDLIYDATKNAR